MSTGSSPGRGRRRLVGAALLGIALAGVACTDAPDVGPGAVQDTLRAARTMADSLERLARDTYADAYTTLYEDSLPSCPGCDIRLVPAGAFGDLDDEFLLRDTPILLERDRRGRFYATVHDAADQELILYEPDGTIVRTVGRLGGDGPGEFRRGITSMLVGPDDSLHVIHDGVMLSVFDSSGAHARTIRLDTGVGVPPNLVRVDAEGYLVAFQTLLRIFLPGESEIARHRLHVFGHDGNHVRSFARPGLADLRATMTYGWPVLAGPMRAWAGGDGSLWIFRRGNYRLERVDHRGQVDRVIGVRPPRQWHLEVNMGLEEVGVNTFPPGGLWGFHPLDEQFGVAVLQVPSEDWESVEHRPHHRYSAEREAIDIHQKRMDSIVDVIDFASGEVIARKRIQLPSRLTSDGTLYSVFVDELGIISVEAFQIELTGFER